VSVAVTVFEVFSVLFAAAARSKFRLDFLSAVLVSCSCVTEAFFIFVASHWLGNPHAVKSDSR
jgi:cytochrome bd-type quinol oxidase subunit 1